MCMQKTANKDPYICYKNNAFIDSTFINPILLYIYQTKYPSEHIRDMLTKHFQWCA